jgi:dihydrofolate reductase
VPFNATKKYVVSHTPKELAWHNSILVTGDVVAELKKLKTMDAPDLHVWGSGNLMQTCSIMTWSTKMHILTYPLVIGSGKRLFEPGVKPQGFKMVDSKISQRRRYCDLRARGHVYHGHHRTVTLCTHYRRI